MKINEEREKLKDQNSTLTTERSQLAKDNKLLKEKIEEEKETNMKLMDKLIGTGKELQSERTLVLKLQKSVCEVSDIQVESEF